MISACQFVLGIQLGYLDIINATIAVIMDSRLHFLNRVYSPRSVFNLKQQLLPAIFLTGAFKHLLVSSTMLSVELQRLWRVIEPRRVHLEERRRILLIFQSYKSLWNTGRFEVFAERNFQVLSPIHATLSRKNKNNKFCTRKLLIM